MQTPAEKTPLSSTPSPSNTKPLSGNQALGSRLDDHGQNIHGPVSSSCGAPHLLWVPLLALAVCTVVSLGVPPQIAQADDKKTTSSDDKGSSDGVERREEGNLVIEDIPVIPPALFDRLRQYQNTRSASLEGWEPSTGALIITTRFGETSQVHRVETPLGARKQLTFYDEPVTRVSVRPTEEENGFLFLKDVGGSENHQILYFDRDSGKARLLTDGEARNGSVTWSRKGDRFAYITTRRDGKNWDIIIDDLEDESWKTSKTLVKDEDPGLWFVEEWSPDDKEVIAGIYRSRNDSELWVVDVKSGDRRQINPLDEKVAYGDATFSGDGDSVFLTTDHGREYLTLYRYELDDGTMEPITGNIDWDVVGLEASPDGKHIAFTVNEDGIEKLYLLNQKTLKWAPVKNVPVGQVYALRFSPDGKKLGFTVNSPQTPGDVYVYDLKSKKVTRWTESEVGGLDTSAFIVPEVIRYETFDKDENGKPRQIPAFVFKPETKGPHPVLVSIHGGPESQYRPFFRALGQYLITELGIAVIGPNVRGSAGYGKTYLTLDNGKLREDSVKDIGSLLDWIDEQPDLDGDRVCVMGGSYGGYMVLASMVMFNERLTCGIDVVGISNFVTFLENTKDYRRDLRRAEYGDESDPEMRKFLESISPLNKAGEIKAPLMVVQGLNDPRVPVGEAEQIVKAVREGGRDVWYLMARDEGHGFRKKSNRDFYTAAIVLFLEEFLLEKDQ